MRRLVEGVLRFKRDIRPGYAEEFRRLQATQTPKVMLLTCSDSRVVPELFGSAGPGDLFVHRNVGNMMPRAVGSVGVSAGDHSEGSALKYAVCMLKVTDVVVAGHSNCGAMKGVLAGAHFPGMPNLEQWLATAEPALAQLNAQDAQADGAGQLEELSRLNVLVQVDHVLGYPCVHQAVAAGRLRVHGWWFNLPVADVYAYERAEKFWRLVDPAYAQTLLDRMEPGT